jgi:UDP-glucuronate decarboxylase
VVELTGSRSGVEYQPLPTDDPKQRRPDITLARERLGWEPTVHLDDGLRVTVDYFRTTIGETAAHI